MLKKIGEEATETVLAAKGGDRLHLVREIADLWFHCMVVLARHGLGPADVLAELQRREGISGLDEKAARKKTMHRSATASSARSCAARSRRRRSTRTTRCWLSTTSARWRRCTS